MSGSASETERLREALDQCEMDLRFLGKALMKMGSQVNDLGGVADAFADRAKRQLAEAALEPGQPSAREKDLEEALVDLLETIDWWLESGYLTETVLKAGDGSTYGKAKELLRAAPAGAAPSGPPSGKS